MVFSKKFIIAQNVNLKNKKENVYMIIPFFILYLTEIQLKTDVK
jgi:hypothetical protein